MANSVDPDQTAPLGALGAVRAGSAMLAYVILSGTICSVVCSVCLNATFNA